MIGSAFDRLEAQLRARALDARTQAIDELAALLEDEARELLDRALGDREPDIRKHACTAIGKSDRRLSRPVLRQALGDSAKAVRFAALDALATIEKDTPLSPLRAALGSSHADVRIEALKQLPDHRASSPAVVGLVADKLDDAESKVRHAALEALFKLEDEGSFIPVRIAMERGPAEVRSAVLVKIAALATSEEGAPVIDAAFDDADASVRVLALNIAASARPRLAERLRLVDPDFALVHRKLGKLSDEDGEGALTDGDLKPMFAALASRQGDVAAAAAHALGRLGDRRVTGALLQLSREHDAALRRHVVQALYDAALAMPSDERVTARLEWLLDDPDHTVRERAFDCLRKLVEVEGPAAALDIAERGLRSAHTDVRFSALQVLVAFKGDATADRLLGEALDDEDSKVRDEAFRTLWAWHSKTPLAVLERAAEGRHATIRVRVVSELPRLKAKGEPLLMALARDHASTVGLAAYKALTKEDKNKTRAAFHLAGMQSPRASVRAAACKDCRKTKDPAELRARLIELVADRDPDVHLAAIEAIDALMPADKEGFRRAFASIHYALRVRAAELCGKRRDIRAIAPMTELLSIDKTRIDHPGEDLRQRAARAMADVGHHSAIGFYVKLLDDEDGHVREMAARGLATACKPGKEQPLVDALSHTEISVRSWAAEGLARLGDERGLPVLIGTMAHEHRPIRLGAVLGLAALGPDGVRGLLRGLEDDDREIQELAFAIVVARDIALARAKQSPDLIMASLAARHPEVRYASAKVLDVRGDHQDSVAALAQELVGPRKPQRASDMKDWPAEDARAGLLNTIVRLLSSEHPYKRYAAARVLTLRPKPLAFWREAERLSDQDTPGDPYTPFTNWEDEASVPRKAKGKLRQVLSGADDDKSREPALVALAPVCKTWLEPVFRQRVVARDATATERAIKVLRYVGAPRPRALPPERIAGFDDAARDELLFGTYVGLARQAPAQGESDETHRIRRDSLSSLADLAPRIGVDAVVPVARGSLSDPHHLVRKAALDLLMKLFEAEPQKPLLMALVSNAADVGRAGVDGIFALGDKQLAAKTLDASHKDARRHALGKWPKLFEDGSLEPWLIALESKHADVRLAVVDRLVDADDDRVTEALLRALESDHDDLRYKAAEQLGQRGDPRAATAMASFLRGTSEGEEAAWARGATGHLVAMAEAAIAEKRDEELVAAVARALSARLEDDPDKTADRRGLCDALSRVGHAAGAPALLTLLQDDQATMRQMAFSALMSIAADRARKPDRLKEGGERPKYREDVALPYLEAAARSVHVDLRKLAAHMLAYLDEKPAEALLGRLVDDRDPEVRVMACNALAHRLEHVASADADIVEHVVKMGRRELVLAAAEGLSTRRSESAFQPLLLVLKAGAADERERAVLSLGRLGDQRAIEELVPLCDPDAEIEEVDLPLSPAAAQALAAMIPAIDDEDKKTEIAELVERLLSSGSDGIKRGILTGLRRAGDERSRMRLERMAGQKHIAAHLRAMAMTELGLVGDAGSETLLAGGLTEDDHSIRHAARTALDKVFPEDKTRVSMHALASPHDDVSVPAASYLSEHGDATQLVQRMAQIKDGAVRRKLRLGLVRRKSLPATEIGTLLSAEDAGARADAAWMAGASEDAALIKGVVKALGLAAGAWQADKDRARSEAWLAAMWACRRLDPRKGAKLAQEALAIDGVPTAVRVEAVRLLSDAKTKAAADALIGCVSADDLTLRVAAATALATLDPKKAAKAIQDLGVGDPAALVPVAAAALDTLGDKALSNELTLPAVVAEDDLARLEKAAAQKGRSDARLIAIAALGLRGGGDALQKILDNDGEDGDVRAAAFKALRRHQRRTRSYEGDKDSGDYSRGGTIAALQPYEYGQEEW